MDIVEKIKKLNSGKEVITITEYDGDYWVVSGSPYNIFMDKYEIFDNEPRRTLEFVEIYSEKGGKILSEGKLIYILD